MGEKECSSIIAKAWQQVDSSTSLCFVMEGIATCVVELGKWNKSSFRHVQKELLNAKMRMKLLQESDPSMPLLLEHNETREEVQKWLERYELM